MHINISRIGILPNERISDRVVLAIVAPAIECTDELTLQHKMVLLKLRDNEASRSILDKLSAMGAPEPSASDRMSMVEATYARRVGWQGELKITPPGLSKANAIIRELAAKYGVHQFTVKGGRGKGTMVHCSCGQVFGPFHNDQFGESRMRSRMVAHERIKPDADVASVVGAASGMEG